MALHNKTSVHVYVCKSETVKDKQNMANLTIDLRIKKMVTEPHL